MYLFVIQLCLRISSWLPWNDIFPMLLLSSLIHSAEPQQLMWSSLLIHHASSSFFTVFYTHSAQIWCLAWNFYMRLQSDAFICRSSFIHFFFFTLKLFSRIGQMISVVLKRVLRPPIRELQPTIPEIPSLHSTAEFKLSAATEFRFCHSTKSRQISLIAV